MTIFLILFLNFKTIVYTKIVIILFSLKNMNIFLGTKSIDKKRILLDCLKNFKLDKYLIKEFDVDPGIVGQPLDEETILKGATNRAKRALELGNFNGLGLGLEGGLTTIKNKEKYYLFCVAVIKSPSKTFIGTSGKLSLPDDISNSIKLGEEFGGLIRKKVNSLNNVNSYYNELLLRKQSFSQAINNVFFNYLNKK